MTSTLMPSAAATATAIEKQTTKTRTSTTTATTTMAWPNEKLRFSCIDNIGLKHLWKLIALDNQRSAAVAATTTIVVPEQTTNHHNHNNNNNNNHNNEPLQQQQQQQQKSKQQSSKEQQFDVKCENLSDYLCWQRSATDSQNPLDLLGTQTKQTTTTTTNRMSLLKFLAINALELSAPATPLLLQQHQQHPSDQQHHHHHHQQQHCTPQGWMQLSGHPESIVPTTSGIVRKRIVNVDDSEVLAYKMISQEPQTAQIVPSYFGLRQVNGQHFIELQDLLAGFKDPCVMDIKMGCRTFLESEVHNKTLRSDLYQKMINVDINAPTTEEHEAKAITKLRYMLFRESLSSSQSKGFRIEALRLRGRQPIKDLKTCRTSEQITQTIEQFLLARKSVQKELLKRLKHMRDVMEESSFFHRHEIVGSSIFIVYDNERVGAWLIDFAKSRQLPPELCVSHRAHWTPGNREEGLLKGMDELINAFETVYARSSSSKNSGSQR